MIVTLDQRLFQSGEVALLRGLRFALAANERRHVLLTSPVWTPEVASQPIQQWLASLSGEIRDAVEKILEAGLDEAPNMSASVARVMIEPISRRAGGKKADSHRRMDCV